MRTKTIFKLSLIFLMVNTFGSWAQQPKDVYQKPLSSVLADVEKSFRVKINYNNALKDKEVQYATWKFTSDLNHTLDNILIPLGLGYRETEDNIYLVSTYEYYRRPESEGKRHLDELLSVYSNAQAFDKRKRQLRQHIFHTLGINPLKDRPDLNPIKRSVVNMEGYTVQNIAFESIPGYFVTGTLYTPSKGTKPHPVILSPNGHFYGEGNSQTNDNSGRYGKDVQYRCAALAKMGAVVFNYDMYSWGESALQSGDPKFHETSFSQSIQAWNSMRALDFLLSLPGTDKSRVGVTGASGGGTQTFIIAALDERISASAPVVMVSSTFFGGCSCETGLPVHDGSDGHKTTNPEIAAMMAPKAQLIVTAGGDWTRTFPRTDFPYMKKIYGYYRSESKIENVHLAQDEHDYGLTKRVPVYNFFAKEFKLDLNAIKDKAGKIDESGCTIQKNTEMQVFGPNGEFPSNALKSHQAIQQAFVKHHTQK